MPKFPYYHSTNRPQIDFQQFPNRSGHWFATYWHLFYTPDIEVLKSVRGVYTAMVKNPFNEWDRVDTFCALLVHLGSYGVTIKMEFRTGTFPKVITAGTSSTRSYLHILCM